MKQVTFKYDIGQAVAVIVEGVKCAGLIVLLGYTGRGDNNLYSVEFIDGSGKRLKVTVRELQLDECN